MKRAILIWTSVIIFKNSFGFINAFGSLLVIIGVLLYNQAKNNEKTVKDSVLDKS
jgi:drug/metabolite transporter (DMT)-like permease